MTEFKKNSLLLKFCVEYEMKSKWMKPVAFEESSSPRHPRPSIALVTCSGQLQGSTCTLSALGPMGDCQGMPWEAHDVYYALKYDWKCLLHQTKSVKYIGKSKEVGTLRYLSLVVPLTTVSDEAVHKELGDRMERAATTASCSEANNHMANLEFCDKHNMIAYLQKSEGSEGFHQIIDFLNASHI
ncbi:hypothetical protein Tco_0331922 [Tanacetum coccineum]